ncbi:MAG TPA: hypothetical protein ENG60_01155 [Thermoplasmatales archaeon]|nr:hypothetical protein [Thermoplasmatales archaeon]HEX17011.1 hypothetical protein [Thermoplasmatales archaeon]
MRVSILILGLVIFFLGFLMLILFAIIPRYTVTLYPLSGYLGICLTTVSLFLIYKGIFSQGQKRSPSVSSEDQLEEWESEEIVMY